MTEDHLCQHCANHTADLRKALIALLDNIKHGALHGALIFQGLHGLVKPDPELVKACADAAQALGILEEIP